MLFSWNCEADTNCFPSGNLDHNCSVGLFWFLFWFGCGFFIFFDSTANVGIVGFLMGWGMLGSPCSETSHGTLNPPHPS